MLRKALQAILAIIIIMAALPAAAVDWKTYNPSACLPIPTSWVYPATGAVVNARFYNGDDAGEIGSSPPAYAPVSVSCPIIRDDTTNANGLAGLKVLMYDVDATAQSSCWVITESPDGITSATVGPLSTGVAFTGTISLDFGTTITQTWVQGPISIFCSLQGQGSMSGIVYSEISGGNTN